MRVIIYDEKGLREEVRNAEYIAESENHINVSYVDVHDCMRKVKQFKKVLIASIFVKIWEGDNDY